MTRPTILLGTFIAGAGLLASVLAVKSTGAAEPLVFVSDAGPLVRWSAPLLRVLHDLAAALTVGGLVVDVVVTRAPALRRVIGGGAVVWAVAALGGVLLTFADAAGLPLGSAGFVDAFVLNAWALDPTRIGLISAAGAAAVAALALTAKTLTLARAASALTTALLSLAVLGLASHTGTSSDHETSVNSMAVHIIAAAIWLGGLLALVILRPRGLGDPEEAVRRWSTIALWCFVAVALSGALAATTRLGAWSDLGTPYGGLVLVKVALLGALGIAGWLHRRSMIRRLADAASGFWRLVVGELAVMAVALGVGSALTRSAPPVPEEVLDPTPTLALTGFPAPPAPTGWSWLLTWRTEWLVLTLAVVAIGTYAAGLVALRRSHRAWPGWRTAAWISGWAMLVAVTSGAPGVYGRVALSWHVAAVVVELLVAPVLLVMGDPMRLCTEATQRRDDGTVGPRELVAGLTGSAAADLLRHPGVAAGLGVLALLALVLGPGLEWTLWTHPGHVITMLGLPVLGVVALSAIADSQRRGQRRAVFGAVAALGTVIVLMGLALVLGSRPLAQDFFVTLQLPWLSDLLAEQRRAGWTLVSVGGIGVGLLVALLLRMPKRERTR